jgi:hypothetical protein
VTPHPNNQRQRWRAAILPRLLDYGDGLRRPGLMGPEIDADDNDSVVDRFLAYCGRDPRS